jgi:hypothetical protein
MPRVKSLAHKIGEVLPIYDPEFKKKSFHNLTAIQCQRNRNSHYVI